MVRYFKDKVEARKRHFSSLFKEPISCNIGEIMKVLSLVRTIFYEEMNIVLRVDVPCEEIH